MPNKVREVFCWKILWVFVVSCVLFSDPHWTKKVFPEFAILGLDMLLIYVIDFIIKNCVNKDNSEQIKFGKYLLPFFPEYFASLVLSKNIKTETELYYNFCFMWFWNLELYTKWRI